MKKAGDVLWGALCGFVLGFIVAKIFETWAILFGCGSSGGTFLTSRSIE